MSSDRFVYWTASTACHHSQTLRQIKIQSSSCFNRFEAYGRNKNTFYFIIRSLGHTTQPFKANWTRRMPFGMIVVQTEEKACVVARQIYLVCFGQKSEYLGAPPKHRLGLTPRRLVQICDVPEQSELKYYVSQVSVPLTVHFPPIKMIRQFFSKSGVK